MKKLTLLFVPILLLSCEDPFFDEDPTNDAVTNFEELWQRMDERYSFFEYKNIDWDSV